MLPSPSPSCSSCAWIQLPGGFILQSSWRLKQPLTITTVFQEWWENCITTASASSHCFQSHLLLWTSVWSFSLSAPFLLLWGFIPRGSTNELWDPRAWEQTLQVKTEAKSALSNLFFLMPFAFTCLLHFSSVPLSLLIYSTLSCCSLCPLLALLRLSFDMPNSILALLEKFSIFSGKFLHFYSFFSPRYLNFASQFSQEFLFHPCWTNFLPFANAALWLWEGYPWWPTSSSHQNHALGGKRLQWVNILLQVYFHRTITHLSTCKRILKDRASLFLLMLTWKMV